MLGACAIASYLRYANGDQGREPRPGMIMR
jgi:hypothetical protein